MTRKVLYQLTQGLVFQRDVGNIYRECKKSLKELRRVTSFSLMIFLYLMCQPRVSAGEALSFYTTNDYPCQTDDGRGATYEIMNYLLTKYYPEAKMRFIPWMRAFTLTKSGERNSVLFTTGQKPERIPYFDWCCYLYEGPSNEIFAMKNKNYSTGDLKSLSGKKTALWRGDSSEVVVNELGKKGVKLEKVVVNDVVQAIKMLLSDRVDFIVTRKPLFLESCKDIALDCIKIEKINHPPIEPRRKLFIVFSKNTDKSVRDRFTTLFKEFRKTDQYQNIVKKWGLTYIGDN